MNKKNIFSVQVIFLFTLLTASCLKLDHKVESEERFVKEKMVFIPEGEFTLGSDLDASPLSGIPSSPEKKIFIKSFYISNIETTNFRYFEFVSEGGYKSKKYWDEKGWSFIKKNNITVPRSWTDGPYDIKHYTYERGNYPVYGIGFFEAKAYSSYRGMRLPTEWEWEKAARGIKNNAYPWGNEFDKFKCNVLETGIGATVLVGSLTLGASPYGIFDMCGNVEEWTSSLYNATENNKSRNGYVVKGGAWEDPAENSKVWSRHIGTLAYVYVYHYGVRLAMDSK